ncbi:CDP-diacylglycerol--glycerol-3-phosphate 3-phosphatidyltransferase [Paenibacillus sp. DMB20]|uniref:CDP-diacylglycerol--glycerol-3-phosphate 3-phosphatidyltransferase n=1 Tax=Paenibacillus sp. DMB20 TaxID=1642570 RepID=UPI00128B5E17|nr:CDP-diacylglycerol--glycerol-3-phosphate 3-phosphatidyltransferase [Paenibacillus sp. DMB20]
MADRHPFFQFIQNYGVYIAAFLFAAAAATDKLDGYIARKYNQITNLGKLLDPLADKLLISAALILMVQHEMIPTWMAMVIIGREIVITGFRLVAASQQIALAADRYGKWKMVLQVTGICAVLLHNYPFQWFTGIPVDDILMISAVVITIYSGINYLIVNYKLLKLTG